jgi:uncharacterized membrane protein
MRTNSIKKIHCEKSNVNDNIGKLLRKHDFGNGPIWIIKLNVNGMLYLVPENMLTTATKEDRKTQPKNEVYWYNEYEGRQTSINRMRDVEDPEPVS